MKLLSDGLYTVEIKKSWQGPNTRYTKKCMMQVDTVTLGNPTRFLAIKVLCKDLVTPPNLGLVEPGG